jgi:hypothetical protein
MKARPAHGPRAKPTWDEKRLALEVLLRKCAIKQSEPERGIPYEWLIPGLARELLLMAPVPRGETLSTKEVKQNLANLAKSTKCVINLLEGLLGSQKAVVALKWSRIRVAILKNELLGLHAAAAEARVASARGQPKKTQPKKIAKFVAQQYYRLSGKRPTVSTGPLDGKASGPFLKLLDGVFDVLGVDASAESQARGLRGRAI